MLCLSICNKSVYQTNITHAFAKRSDHLQTPMLIDKHSKLYWSSSVRYLSHHSTYRTSFSRRSLYLQSALYCITQFLLSLLFLFFQEHGIPRALVVDATFGLLSALPSACALVFAVGDRLGWSANRLQTGTLGQADHSSGRLFSLMYA